jgi:hypothetical protein
MRRQRPVKGGRHPLPSCVLADIQRAVEADAMRYGVSKSFVISVILARAYRITEQESIQEHEDRDPAQPHHAVPLRLRVPPTTRH